jgi:hypothetical protein
MKKAGELADVLEEVLDELWDNDELEKIHETASLLSEICNMYAAAVRHSRINKMYAHDKYIDWACEALDRLRAMEDCDGNDTGTDE